MSLFGLATGAGPRGKNDQESFEQWQILDHLVQMNKQVINLVRTNLNKSCTGFLCCYGTLENQSFVYVRCGAADQICP